MHTAYTHTHTHTSMYTYIYIYIYMCVTLYQDTVSCQVARTCGEKCSLPGDGNREGRERERIRENWIFLSLPVLLLAGTLTYSILH